MTQSKPSESEINMDELDITIDLGSTTTVSIPDYSIGDIYVDSHTMDSTFTVDINDIFTDTIDISNITFDRVMFEDDMPDPQELKRMCEEYPGLEKAYENFKTVYKMVEQDWRGKQDTDEDSLF
jgi:hypothetical protein